MPAKRPAPKSAKGKKAASRPAVKKAAAARKPAERVKAAAAPVRKAAPAPRRAPGKGATPAPMDVSKEPPQEMRKSSRAAPEPRVEPSAGAPPSNGRSDILVSRRESPAPAVSTEVDEAEGVEPGSLLAGPRNVQPYIAKRGEQYMSKEQLEHFRHILNSWKRDLMVEVDRTVSHMKDEAANFPDPNDRATQEEEFSLELRTRDRERKLIRKIDDALKRIEDGSYGYCLETGEEIGIKRLEARPVATLSIEAQERRERRERQYGDRDDRYR
jgi:DnaK suppressor protein